MPFVYNENAIRSFDFGSKNDNVKIEMFKIYFFEHELSTEPNLNLLSLIVQDRS